ncbi:MAG TPA: STAS domain-containing protein [Gammaproteobacteria bacterium]|nr:STAS domain-containing protein [Gammaproteobacteria bacterium]
MSNKARQGSGSPNTPRKKRALTVNCEESFDISRVSALHEKLTKALNEGRSVTIDAIRVERTDAAMLQMLSAFARDSREKSVTLKWKSVSEEFRNSANLLDLDGVLELPAV